MEQIKIEQLLRAAEEENLKALIKIKYFINPQFTLVAGFQFYLPAVAPVAPVGSSPDPEYIGGPRLQPVHCHHVGASLQDRVVLLPLVLKWSEKQGEKNSILNG